MPNRHSAPPNRHSERSEESTPSLRASETSAAIHESIESKMIDSSLATQSQNDNPPRHSEALAEESTHQPVILRACPKNP